MLAKFGNAAMFGAGATFGGDMVNDALNKFWEREGMKEGGRETRLQERERERGRKGKWAMCDFERGKDGGDEADGNEEGRGGGVRWKK
jgi:hypothetical protein